MAIVEMLTNEGRRLLINTRREATSIMLDDALVMSFDREGRMIGAWTDGRNLHRTLDNHIIEKREGPLPGLSYRVRRELPPEEASEFRARVRRLVREFHDLARQPASPIVNAASAVDREECQIALEEILACSEDRLDSEAATFRKIYKPINILPPDQYLALVLQATEGCSYNKCTFCGFYRDRAFRIKEPDEFRQHLRDVRVYFGRAINLRKTVFLADANALVIPHEALLPLFDIINSELAIEPGDLTPEQRTEWRGKHPVYFEGIYSFVDAFTTRRKQAADYADLAARGLRRVYIGMESGDVSLLKFLGKPHAPEDVAHLVKELKQAHVAVGLIILAGAGGCQFDKQHVRNTIQMVNSLPLDSSDLVYLSELVDYPASAYSRLAQEAGIKPLTVEQIGSQMQEIKAGLRFSTSGGKPKVSYYDIREFTY